MGDMDNDELALLSMTAEERERGRVLVRLASVLQFTLPGIPCIYYGDEAGMEGYRDPFNRRPYPWGEEDTVLLAHYRRLAQIRREYAVFADGTTEILYAEDGVFDFIRERNGERLRICVNRGETAYPIAGSYRELISGACAHGCVTVGVDCAVILAAI
ncbi:MAG: hypothetical protein IJ302_03870, partial [Clostridia bacterium]|nr:hypothetical protein [Clostridia bacterium]